MTDWMDAAASKLKEVGESIVQDVQGLLDEAAPSALVSLNDGSTVEVPANELESL
jgi:hypothetical protein